jgi:ATP-binding cassette subfamily B protein
MKKKEKNKILKTYFHYVLQNKFLYIVIIITTLIIAFVDALQPYWAGRIVDQLTNSDFQDGHRLIMILMGAIIFRAIIEQLSFAINGYIDIVNLDRNPRTDYVKKIQSLDYQFHSTKSTGSLISISRRINDGFNKLFNNLNVWGLIHVLDVAISTYFIYTVDHVSALIFVITLVLSALLGYPILKWHVKVRKEFIDWDDKIGGIIGDNMTCFETIKAFGQEEYEVEKLNKTFEPWQKQAIRYLLSFRAFDITVYTITIIGAIIIVSNAYNQVAAGLWSIGTLVTLLSYSTGMIWKAFNIVYKAKDYMKASVDLEKFVDVMDTESAVKEKNNAKEIGDIKKGISFKNVSFTYTESEDGKKTKYVLDDIDFDIKLDQTVAFVGRSGSGKTTLAKLLMRYYDVEKGSIQINGIDVRDLKLKSLRKSIGLVPQDPVMFNESIKYNISYGRTDASMDEIVEATKKAALHSFIESLPEGYDTIVGERGIKLSGGQRQRLAIARVILEDPEIIVFDEATSQLDSENEKAIQEAFSNLTKHKTTIIIAHRLSTVMNADKIVVFDEGKIVESGTHTELMNLNGIYAMLWKLQTEN